MTHLPTPVSHLHVAPAIRSLLWTTWLALALPAASQPLFDAYVVEPWDDSYSLASSHIGDLNDLNVGVGTAHFQGATAEPFLWTPAEGKDVADVGPDDINDLGVTASFGRIWWAPGNSQAIPHPDGGVGVRIRDLNNANVVCGDAPVTERPRAFVWDAVNGSRWLEDLGVPSTTWHAYAINDAGLLAGSRSLTGEPGDEQAFVLDVPAERTIDIHAMLNPSGTGITRVLDVAENGVVAGEGSYEDGTAIAGFIWSEAAGFTFLPGLNGGDAADVHPNAVNETGTVVGSAIDGGGEWRAFIWNAAYGMRDLESLATLPPGFNLEEATVINGNGWVVARGFWSAVWGPDRAVVFAPQSTVDAPTALDPTGPALRVARSAHGSADIRFLIASATVVRLGVFDVQGRRVASLADGLHAAGEHRASWAGTTGRGAPAGPGVYFVRLRAGTFEAVERFVRLP